MTKDKYGCGMCINCYEDSNGYYCKFDKLRRNLRGGGPWCNFNPSKFEEIPAEDTPFIELERKIMDESERQIYKCLKCNGTKFRQLVKEEYYMTYDSVKHVVTEGFHGSVGSPWECEKCYTKILLKDLHGILIGVTLKLLEEEEKLKRSNGE